MQHPPLLRCTVTATKLELLLEYQFAKNLLVVYITQVLQVLINIEILK